MTPSPRNFPAATSWRPVELVGERLDHRGRAAEHERGRAAQVDEGDVEQRGDVVVGRRRREAPAREVAEAAREEDRERVRGRAHHGLQPCVEPGVELLGGDAAQVARGGIGARQGDPLDPAAEGLRGADQVVLVVAAAGRVDRALHGVDEDVGVGLLDEPDAQQEGDELLRLGHRGRTLPLLPRGAATRQHRGVDVRPMAMNMEYRGQSHA
jgi:hypothetical protein